MSLARDNVEKLRNLPTDTTTVNRSTATMTTLLSEETTDTINVKGYYAANDGGGGIFNWDSTANKNTANGGTIVDPSVSLALQGTGVGNGCWVRQYNGPILARWFGAKGDGSTDDTSLTTKAIATTEEILFTDGVFNVTGLTANNANQKFRCKDASLYLITGSNTPIFTVSANGVVFDSVSTNGNASGQTTTDITFCDIYLSNGVTDVTVMNSTVTNSKQNGIGGYGNNADCIFHNNKISSVGFNGINPSSASGFPFNRGVISNNRITTCGQDGIGTVAMTNTTVIGNTIKDHVTAGISFEARCDYSTIVGNTILGDGVTSGQGIQVNDAIGVVVSGNHIKDCGGGILVAGGSTSYNISITGNTIDDSGFNQHSCINVSSGVANSFLTSYEYGVSVVGNTIRNASTTAIFINAANGVVVEGNTIKNWNTTSNTTATRYMAAIMLRNFASYNNISNNNIAEGTPAWYRIGIIEVGDSQRTPAANIIENNRISGVDQDILTQYNTAYQSRVVRFTRGTAAPTSYSWLRGQEFLHSFPAAGGYYGWMSTDADGGSFSSNFTSATADTTIGSATISNISTTDGLFEGMSISVAGAFTSAVIVSISQAAGTAILNKTASATTTGAAVTLYAPTFKQFGAILP